MGHDGLTNVVGLVQLLFHFQELDHHRCVHLTHGAQAKVGKGQRGFWIHGRCYAEVLMIAIVSYQVSVGLR